MVHLLALAWFHLPHHEVLLQPIEEQSGHPHLGPGFESGTNHLQSVLVQWEGCHLHQEGVEDEHLHGQEQDWHHNYANVVLGPRARTTNKC